MIDWQTRYRITDRSSAKCHIHRCHTAFKKRNVTFHFKNRPSFKFFVSYFLACLILHPFRLSISYIGVLFKFLFLPGGIFPCGLNQKAFKDVNKREPPLQRSFPVASVNRFSKNLIESRPNHPSRHSHANQLEGIVTLDSIRSSGGKKRND